jgi:transposase
MKKYLDEDELKAFVEWCKRSNLTQKEIAKMAGFHEQWVSMVFSRLKPKRNKNFKALEKKNFKFDRAKAKLIVMMKKLESAEDYKDVNFLTD